MFKKLDVVKFVMIQCLEGRDGQIPVARWLVGLAYVMSSGQ